VADPSIAVAADSWLTVMADRSLFKP
jgi:hypothetical protein